MAIKSFDQIRSELKTVDTGVSPEISVNPLQTEFRDNTWSEEIFHPIQQSNWIASNVMDETNGVDNTPDPEFNFYANIKGTEYERDADYFTEAQNEPYFDALKLRYEREKRNRASIERGGWSSMGWSFVGAMLGPENLIPGSLAARGVKQGYSLSKSAANVGGAGALATTISEYGLQSSQGLLTGEESLLAIGMGTVFSGGLGAGLAGFANKGIKSKVARKFDEASNYSDEFRTKLESSDLQDQNLQIQLSKEADAIIQDGKIKEVEAAAKLSDEIKTRIANDDWEKDLDKILKESRTINRKSNLSAASDAPTLDDLSIYGRAASKTAQATKWFNPILRSMHSPSAHARRVAANLFENPVMMKMNDYRDSPAAIESKIKNWTEGRLADVIGRMGTTGNDGIYTDMIKSGVHMTRPEFRKEVARAMRRNDGNQTISGEDTGRSSGQFNEHIMKAAKVARKDLFEYARQELNKVGVEVKSKKSSTADSYLTRVWNRKKLQTGEAKFKDHNGAVWNYIRNAIDLEIESATRQFEKRIDNLNREIDELKMEKLRRQSQIEEAVKPTLASEWKKLADLEQKIADVEAALRQGPQVSGELDEVLSELVSRFLPSNVRVELVDQIGRDGAPTKDFTPAAKNAATNLVDDIAGGDAPLTNKSREITEADTPEGKAEIEKYGAVGSKEWAKNKAAEARRAAKKNKTIDHTKSDDDTLYNLKEDYEPEDGISSKEFIDLLHRHPVKAMLFHSLDDGKTWYDPAGLMAKRNLLTDGYDADEIPLVDLDMVDRIDAFLESLPDRVYKDDGSLISVNPYGKLNYEPITRNENLSGDLIHNFDIGGTGRVEVHDAPKVVLDEHGVDEGYELFIRTNSNTGAPDVRLLVEKRLFDVDTIEGEIIEFEIGTKAGEKFVYDWDNDSFVDVISEELDAFGLLKQAEGEFEPLSLSWHSVFDDSLEALGPEYRSGFVSVDGKFYSPFGSLKYIRELPDDPKFSILKHNAEVSEFMAHAARTQPELLLERFASRQTFEPPKNLPLLEKSLDNIENDPTARSVVMGDDVYYQRGANNIATGSFDTTENLIQITRSALNPEQTLRHETIHALRALNLFEENEWTLLEKSAKELGWVEKHNIAKRYDGVFEGDEVARHQSMIEESIAEEFSKWQKGQLKVTPEVQTIFERIKQILGNIATALKEVGVNSYEDIFKLIDEGDIAGRARVQKEAELQTLQNRFAETKNNIDRLEQFKFVPPEITPSDVQDILSVISKNKKPKKPETLSEFLSKNGGITDEDRSLSKLGVTLNSHPKLVISARDAINENFASVAEKIDKGQPLSLDDAAFIAWNEGFFPELPSRQKFLKTLKDDLELGESVRYNDITKLNKYNDIAAVEAEAARLGITDGEQPFKFARTPYEGDVVAAVSRLLDERADKKITNLEARKSAEEIEFNNKMFPIENDLDGHADEVVSDVYNKLTGRLDPEYIDKENIIDFGFLKNRTFGIRDELIEEFLEDDIEMIMRRYVRNVAGQIELKKRFGNLHLRNHKQAIQEEFEALRQEVQYSDKSPSKKEKALAKLDGQEKDVIRSIDFARDKILGRYEYDLDSSGWARTVDAALSWQYMTSLGGVLLTSSLDVWRHPMQQGFARVFGKQLPALIAGNKGTKINRELARKYAGIAEIIHNSRLAHMAGLSDPYQVSTPAEIAIQKMTDRFSKLTGLPYWNQFHKEFAGALIIDRAVENMVKGIDNISAKEARWMRHLGLGDMATQAKALQASGALEKVQGIWTINPDKLPDFLVEQFFAGVKKEIDTTIVSKGMGDAPLFTETNIGRIVSQFKSFGAASNQRMLIRGMQDDTGNFVGGLAGMVTSGMFVYMLKQLEAGREIDDNPNTWLVEGLDRSGAFFLFFEANNIWEKVGGYGAYQALGAKDPASRFASRNAVGAAMGPLFGTANDLLAILGNGARLLNPNAEFDPTPGDVKALRRTIPYVTLPYWRFLVDGYIVPHMQDEVR